MPTDKELKIIDAAQKLFFRHGFKRVTMNDIADGAGMSRPALYLVFANKEEIFEAVVRHSGGENLTAMRQGVANIKPAAAQLMFLFEQWTVRPFEMIRQSPDARDLIESSHGFAKVAMDEVTAGFEQLVREVLAEAAGNRGSPQPKPAEIARLLVTAAYGFKVAAASTEDLRGLLRNQITLALTTLTGTRTTAAKQPANTR